ncbi:hypothetical protein JMJ35_010101 [Cladonia borealis]|uniref:Alcohol dehydrogenase-like N-terminal domain-containing protein n=1 Tax=Cladonia borealis TaxID=184061 RepID=A0AA39QTR8_9LECA|nr:hypothetical protein JMJ35_010101 [Cladonia borealis]
MTATSEPSVEERNFFDRFRPTIEDEPNAASVTMTQNPTETVSNTAREDSTPDVPQTKLQDISHNPHKTTQEEDQQSDKQGLNNHPTSQREPDLPTPPIEQTHQNTSNPPTSLTNQPKATEPPTTFHGWLAHSPTSPLTWGPFTPKTWEETDVDIAITHCGVCYSDLCTLRSGWGPTKYPVCVGHEIIGLCTRVGTSAPPHITPGTRLGIGPTSYHCSLPTCPPCSTSATNYCPSRLSTYASTYPHLPPDSNTTYGGFATHTRQNARAVHVIPKGVVEAEGDVLCGGDSGGGVSEIGYDGVGV